VPHPCEIQEVVDVSARDAEGQGQRLECHLVVSTPGRWTVAFDAQGDPGAAQESRAAKPFGCLAAREFGLGASRLPNSCTGSTCTLRGTCDARADRLDEPHRLARREALSPYLSSQEHLF
jgi:hypothetical protein